MTYHLLPRIPRPGGLPYPLSPIHSVNMYGVPGTIPGTRVTIREGDSSPWAVYRLFGETNQERDKAQSVGETNSFVKRVLMKPREGSD